MAAGSPVGQVLQRYRMAAALTQEALAERAGLSTRGISDIERGLKRHPHAHTLHCLADALALSPADRALLLHAARSGPAHRRPTPLRGVALPTGGFLGAIPVGPLVERQDELTQIATAVDSVEGGSGRVILIAGEAGVGKTRLLQEVFMLVAERGFVSAPGRCYAPEQSIPFYAFLEVLTYLRRSASAQTTAGLPRGSEQLARLFPEDPQTAPRAPASVQEEYHVFRVIEAFVRDMAARAPVALLLDDLHWADGATLKLVLHLARFTRDARVLLIGTYRDAEHPVNDRLEEVLRDLHREGLEAHVTLGRLTLAGTAKLVTATVGPVQNGAALAAFLQQRSEGNAFFSQEVLRDLVERRYLVPGAAGATARLPEELLVPATVRAVILQRFSRLDGSARTLLLDASVLGHTFSFDAVVALGSRSEDAVERCLEQGRRAGFLRITGKDQYAFNHALTHQALSLELAPRRRRCLHLVAAEVLQHRAGDVRAAEVLWHLLQADAKERAAPVALQAGDQAAAVFAHDEAEQHYATARALAHAIGDRGQEIAALTKLAPVLLVRHQQHAAHEALDAALRLCHACQDMQAAAGVLAQIGRAHGDCETFSAGLAILEPVISTLTEAVTPEARAELYAVQSGLFQECGRYQEALTAVECAAALLAPDGNPALRSEIEHGRTATLWELGALDWDLPQWDEAVAVAERRDDLVSLARALRWAYLACRYRGDLAASKAYLRRGTEVYRHTNNPYGAVFWWSRLGYTAYLMGDWGEARAMIETAFALHADTRSPQELAWPLLDLGTLELAEGETSSARAHLEAALALTQRSHQLDGLRRAHLGLARLELCDGQAASAIGRLLPLLDRPGSEEFKVTELLPTLALAHLARGDRARAEQRAADAVRRAAGQHNRFDRAAARGAQGEIYASRGAWPEAACAFTDTLMLVQAMPYPHAEALTLYHWGLMSACQGDAAQARRHLGAALVIFRRIGARPDIARTEHALMQQ